MKNILSSSILSLGIIQSAFGATPLPPPTITSAATPSAIYLNQVEPVTELTNWPNRLLVIGNDINQTNLAAQMQLSTWPATLAALQATATATNNVLAQTDLLELANWPTKLINFQTILNDPGLPGQFAQTANWPQNLLNFQYMVSNESPFFFQHNNVQQVFAPTSFWYTPIPNNAPLNPQQIAYQADFTAQFNASGNNVFINDYGDASTVFTVPANQPTVQVVSCSGANAWVDPSLSAQFAAVPIPAYAVGDEGTDHEMTIYQPSTNSIWEFWKAQQVNGQWSACWGGSIINANTSDGIFPLYYGATATSIPFLGGQVSAAELQNGVINHAIGIALPYTAVNTNGTPIFSWPAHRSDGYGGSIIPEGTRFRIDPTINLDTLGLSHIGKIIAKAGQIYGFVVWDITNGNGITLRFNDDLSYTANNGIDPYPALYRPYIGHEYDLLNNVPFGNLQFLPMDYGKP